MNKSFKATLTPFLLVVFGEIQVSSIS